LVRKKVVRGERAGFAEFYEANKDGCLRAVAASVADRGLAEEIVAKAFSRAWSSWAIVSRHPAPAAWVVRTALNAVMPGEKEEFQRRYRAEVDAHPEPWEPLADAMREGEVTLVYSSRDREHNNAVVLRDYLLEHTPS
jgi:RNA polymerase sigma-70 factor (ECF subfamily)